MRSRERILVASCIFAIILLLFFRHLRVGLCFFISTEEIVLCAKYLKKLLGLTHFDEIFGGAELIRF